MKKLQAISFVGMMSNCHPTSRLMYTLLVECSCRDFGYEQTSDIIKEKGFYIAEDQFDAFKILINVEMDLVQGLRRKELLCQN